jgi:NtrC-family two-component system response regulator AlgB
MASTGEVSAPGRILIVDDETNIIKTFRFCLEDAGHRVASARSGSEASSLVQQEVFDLCFLDLRLGQESGLDLIPILRTQAPWMKIVIITAYSSIESAVEAIRLSASDYLAKPCTPEQLRIAARQQLEARRLEARLAKLEKQLVDPLEFSSQSPAMMHVLEMARSVADTDATVLIRGPSGTGKGVLARAIHHWSGRAKREFAVINCPSLSAELLESELFGHKKGAGAVRVIAGIKDPVVIDKILTHLKKKAACAEPLVLAQSRAPPQRNLFDWFSVQPRYDSRNGNR